MITLVKKGQTYSSWNIDKKYDIEGCYKVPVIKSTFIKVISRDLQKAYEVMDSTYGTGNWEYDDKIVPDSRWVKKDWKNKEYVDQGENTILPFGKYKGLTLKQVFVDKGYFEWFVKNTDDDNLKNTIKNCEFWKEYNLEKFKESERAKINVTNNAIEIDDKQRLQLTFEKNLKVQQGTNYAWYYHTVGDTIFKLVFKHFKEYFYAGYAYALPKVKGNGKRIKGIEYILGVEKMMGEEITVKVEKLWDEQLHKYVEKPVKRQTLVVLGMQEVK